MRPIVIGTILICVLLVAAMPGVWQITIPLFIPLVVLFLIGVWDAY